MHKQVIVWIYKGLNNIMHKITMKIHYTSVNKMDVLMR